MDQAEGLEISTQILMNILDHSSDEIYVLDKDTRIVYVNKVCEKHYGLKPDNVIGKYNDEFVSAGYWTPSIIPLVFEKKSQVTIKQTTNIGSELITTAVPILNKQNEIELIVSTSRQQNYKTMYLPADDVKVESENIHFLEHNLITNNQTMKKLIRFCEKIAQVDTTILVQGESGTGKSYLAGFIHKMSKRSNGPFLTINCAAIPEELLESELFGYVQGAFTGANRGGKMGLIEAANHGTIFLDEIGEISPKLQAKLLQVIQEKRFLPVGGRDVKELDIRIISATNQNLTDMVKQKRFREDLYYRLQVIELKLPPLRERVEDIIPLTYYFLNSFNKKYQVNHVISQEALDILAGYSWPGNVRQLQNVMERLVVTSDFVIEPSDLPEIIVNNVTPKIHYSYSTSLDLAVEELEKKIVVDSYKRLGSSRKVADHLKISQTKASKLIRKYCSEAIADT